MNSVNIKKDKKLKPKSEHKKLIKLVNDSDSDTESIHELSHYFNDRIKLMKEVIQILKPKKIKSMAPNCMKRLSTEELNSMLLEELLGISNKRLKSIIRGEPQDDDSSSTDEEDQDIISLDDVTDDDFVIDLDSDDGTKKNKKKVKQEHKRRHKPKIKEEQTKDNKKTDNKVAETGEENLMSVLELLELQARARAIRSQLILESKKKIQQNEDHNNVEKVDDVTDAEDAVIIESPKNEEIIITSSDSEVEDAQSSHKETVTDTVNNSTGNQNGEQSVNETNKSRHTIDESLKRLDVVTENLEDINKLFNKLHKMKKQKRKSDEQDVNQSGKKCRRKLEKLKEKNRLLEQEAESSNNYPGRSEKGGSEDHSIVGDINCVTTTASNVEVDSISAEESALTKSKNNTVEVASIVEGNDKDVDESDTNLGCKTTFVQPELNQNQNINIEDQNADEGDGIILNVDESEMESINLD